MLQTAEDEHLDGRTFRLGGKELVNFGSCSYLGLEVHPALREGVIDAVTRYGTQFSSSRSYVSAPLYAELTTLLDELFGGYTMTTWRCSPSWRRIPPDNRPHFPAVEEPLDEQPVRRTREDVRSHRGGSHPQVLRGVHLLQGAR
jgi:hypothetical protein